MSQNPILQMKSEIAIAYVSKYNRLIVFDASQDAAEELKQFGKVTLIISPDHYHLNVDARYDFQEVVDYIKSYGK